jgi:hypothetical protein
VKIKTGACIGCTETSIRTSAVLTEISYGLLQSVQVDCRMVAKIFYSICRVSVIFVKIDENRPDDVHTLLLRVN